MLIRRRRGWELPQSAATPEAVFRDRRKLLKAMGMGSLLAPAFGLAGRAALAAPEPDPSATLYPAKRNPKYTLDRPLTPEKIVANYNNYYEFGSQKEIADLAQAVKLRPWTVKIDGLVEKPLEIGIDDLLKKMPLEERLYRHRCVEAWSIAVPWTGFAMSALLDLAKPLSSAKYVVMQTFLDKKVAPGQNQFWYPWPYIEGLTMFEAKNELSFLVTGMYGHPLDKQNGAPLRLAVPWKYGFKSTKAIVRFSFSDKRPVSFWTTLQGNEYGFWANVNPAVPHPRWSQASERFIGEKEERRPTLIWNGYGDYVAAMYAGIKGEELYR